MTRTIDVGSAWKLIGAGQTVDGAVASGTCSAVPAAAWPFDETQGSKAVAVAKSGGVAREPPLRPRAECRTAVRARTTLRPTCRVGQYAVIIAAGCFWYLSPGRIASPRCTLPPTGHVHPVAVWFVLPRRRRKC